MPPRTYHLAVIRTKRGSVAATQPRYARITAKWYVRGGIYTNVIAEHRKKGWKPQPAVDLPSMPMERGLLG